MSKSEPDFDAIARKHGMTAGDRRVVDTGPLREAYALGLRAAAEIAQEDDNQHQMHGLGDTGTLMARRITARIKTEADKWSR